MNQLTNKQVESFHRDGYLHIENAISQSTVSLCRQACERMRSKCESGRYPNIRHEYLIADNEFRGIEHIFSEPVFEEEILKALIETKVLEFSKQLLKEDEVSLILNRLHCTKYYGLSGFWHRDGACRENWHVQSSLHFYNEAGFFVVPGSHLDDPNDDRLIREYGGRRDSLDNMKLLPVRAGDLLLFDSAIFHRGQCPGRKKFSRAHVHLRICRDTAVKNLSIFKDEGWSHMRALGIADDGWKDLFTKERPEPKFYMESITRNNEKSLKFRTRQFKNRLSYGLSRFLGRDSELLRKPNRIIPYPYVKIPEGYEEFLREKRDD
jgi:hypothetical protein